MSTTSYMRHTQNACIWVTSQIKLKVCELATGNKFTEEWDFLPRNWNNTLNTTLTIFDKNFVYLEFEDYDPDAGEPGDILILNLATRRRTWMDRREIQSQIRMKIPEHEIEGEPFVLDDFVWSCGIPILYRMKVRPNEIELKHQTILDDFRYGDLFIGRSWS